ncbi:MAG TPA: c-type cytochrome [Candidatus Tectomicrobia bacterium]|nr:c-type cytochrome [Candidatus Tectomicrobia bacterium]
MRGVVRLIAICGVLAWLVGPRTGSPADPEAGRRKAEVCVPCHGPDGNSNHPAIPSLAGQPPLYTYYQLLQFREGQRVDPQMSPFAMGLSEAEMQDIGAYYAVQAPLASPRAGDAAKMEAARRLVQTHYCDSCHAPGLIGQKHIPRLAGQHYEYLLSQLRAYKAQTRPDMEGSMTMAAQPLSADDIEVLAHYISRLGPVP